MMQKLTYGENVVEIPDSFAPMVIPRAAMLDGKDGSFVFSWRPPKDWNGEGVVCLIPLIQR